MSWYAVVCVAYHIRERTCVCFNVKLPGHCQAAAAAEEILGEINMAGLVNGDVGHLSIIRLRMDFIGKIVDRELAIIRAGQQVEE